MEENNGYPRVLDKKGCLFGISIQKGLATFKEAQEDEVKELKDTLKAQTKLLRGVLVALTTSSILLALNLLMGGV